MKKLVVETPIFNGNISETDGESNEPMLGNDARQFVDLLKQIEKLTADLLEYRQMIVVKKGECAVLCRDLVIKQSRIIDQDDEIMCLKKRLAYLEDHVKTQEEIIDRFELTNKDHELYLESGAHNKVNPDVELKLHEAMVWLKNCFLRTWGQDALFITCTDCSKSFSLLVRRHHCRLCGKGFCDACTTGRVHTTASRRPQRACRCCTDFINALAFGDYTESVEENIEIREVLLHRGPEMAPLGLDLKWHIDECSFRIENIVPGLVATGNAEGNCRIDVGDHIIQIGTVSLKDVNKEQATALLRSDELIIILRIPGKTGVMVDKMDRLMRLLPVGKKIQTNAASVTAFGDDILPSTALIPSSSPNVTPVITPAVVSSTTVPAVASPSPIKSVPAVASPNPIKSVPAVVSPNPIKSVPAVASPNPIKSVPAVVSPNPIKSVPVVASPNPIKSVPAVASPNPIKSVPAVTSPNPIKSVPAVTSPNPIKSVTRLAGPKTLLESGGWTESECDSTDDDESNNTRTS